MVNRMEREERAREEERAEKLAAKQAEEAAARPSTDPFGGGRLNVWKLQLVSSRSYLHWWQ